MRHVQKQMAVLHLKALQEQDAPGTFEAIVATFGNEDPVGDVVMPGSFLDTIKAGLPPVVWSHDWRTPPIGVTLDMDEITLALLKQLLPGGVPDDVTGALRAKARLLVDQAGGEDVPLARAIYAAMVAKGGDGQPALSEFSWGGDVLVETMIVREGSWPQFQLQQIDLTEWGPCLKGMNPETALLAAKALKAAGPVDAETARNLLARGRKAAPAPASDSLSPHQAALAGRLRDVVTAQGKFTKAAAESFYDADGNPFASRGITCANCIFFTPDEGSVKVGTCDMVAGAIDAVDWCKLHIIPAGKITGSSGGSKAAEPEVTKAADGEDEGEKSVAGSEAGGEPEIPVGENADDPIVAPEGTTQSQPPVVTPEDRARIADVLLAS